MADKQETVEVDEFFVHPNEVALAAMQGMLAAGADPQTAAGQAWLVAVPAYYSSRDQYSDMMDKLHAAAANVRS
jgi:hypothetical protein